MKSWWSILTAMLILIACSDSRETRVSRFILQGNAMLEKQDFESAVRYYREALRLDSCNLAAFNNLGTVYFKQKQYTEAIARYDSALFCSPAFADAYYNRANTWYRMGRYDSALSDVGRLKRIKPDTSVLYLLEGLIHTRQRNFDLALRAFNTGLAKDTTNTELAVNIGTLYYYKGDWQKSKEVLEKVIQSSRKEANAYNTLSMVYAASGEMEKASQAIGSALALQPSDAFFLNNRGYISLLQNQNEKALADINQSIALDPYNGWAYRNKGVYYLKVGDPTSAIRLLEQAVSLDRTIEGIYQYLALAYAMQGNNQQACVWKQKAEELLEQSLMAVDGYESIRCK